MESAERKFTFRVMFKLRMYESAGESFQLLVSELKVLEDARFQPIRPWGNWGDGGNDGWIPDDGHYFQVFGPKANSENPPMAVLQKAIDDFAKLPAKWQQIRRYSFVINDRFEGVPAPLSSALQALETSAKLENARAVHSYELLSTFMALPEDCRLQVLRGYPAETNELADTRAVGELLSELAQRAPLSVGLLTGRAPDFDEKIAFNGLAGVIGARLRANSWNVAAVDDFLRKLDEGHRQGVALEVHGMYERSRLLFGADPDAPSLRYFWLIEQLVPAHARSNRFAHVAYQHAAEMVLAKYFETCDAYDDPSRPTST